MAGDSINTAFLILPSSFSGGTQLESAPPGLATAILAVRYFPCFCA
jgi:hypothetical protein